MTISLPPEFEQYVQQKVEAGQYPDSASVVIGALELMRAQEQLAREDREWLRREVERGIEQLDRGESSPFDAEEIKAEGRRLLEARRKKTG